MIIGLEPCSEYQLLKIQSQVCPLKLTRHVYLVLLEGAAFLMPLDSIKYKDLGS
jgi:hypothetical protein